MHRFTPHLALSLVLGGLIGACDPMDEDVADRGGKLDDGKVVLCHHGKDRAVSGGAVAGHLAHGDFLGPCVPPHVIECGDGVVEGDEECDDANDDNTDDCVDGCMLASCGDGLLWGGVEQCDDGADNGDTKACKTDCTPAVCGDGLVAPGETCDDGNADDTDGCLTTCQLGTLFEFTGACDTFVVPPAVTSLTVEAWGAEGGGGDPCCANATYGGDGGYTKGTIEGTPGEELVICVGGRGAPYSYGPYLPGGFNGGGGVATSGGGWSGGSGGGATDLRQGGSSLEQRVIVGGGGGGANYSALVGGAGGPLEGAAGLDGPFGTDRGHGGGGGTQLAGGVGGSGSPGGDGQSGSFGQGGEGGAGVGSYNRGGGGGGGWFGGGGGEGLAAAGQSGAGGGGSSHATPTAADVVMLRGVRQGHGLLKLAW